MIYYDFVEIPLFMRHIKQKATLEVRDTIQAELLADPERGDIVEGTGGVRKARLADPKRGKGKRGGFRYLYLFLEHRGKIYLVYLYGKNEQDNISADQKKMMKEVVEQIKGGAL